MALPREFKKFKHATRTSIKEARLTYHDAIALVIAKLGNPPRGVTSDQVKQNVRTWTTIPQKTLVQYMSSTYCGSSESATWRLKTISDPNSESVKTYWYRVGKGRYRLTKLGQDRVDAVMKEVKTLNPLVQMKLGFMPDEVSPKTTKSPRKTAIAHRPPQKSPQPPAPPLVEQLIPASAAPLIDATPRASEIAQVLRSLPAMTTDQLVKLISDVQDLMKNNSLTKNDLLRIVDTLF